MDSVSISSMGASRTGQTVISTRNLEVGYYAGNEAVKLFEVPDSEIEKENAGIGFTYDSAKNVFTPPQPYPSWTLEESTSEWKPPIAEPDPNPDADGRWLEWNEELYQSDNTKGWEYLELSE